MAFVSPFIPPLGVEYKTVAQAAKILQVDPVSIHRYIKQGKLRSIKLGGTRRVLFSTSPGGVEQDLNYAEIVQRIGEEAPNEHK